MEFEVIELRFPRGTTREESRRALTERAEHGSWELAGFGSTRTAAVGSGCVGRIIRQRLAVSGR